MQTSCSPANLANCTAEQLRASLTANAASLQEKASLWQQRREACVPGAAGDTLPLLSVAVLTCNRHSFLRLALRAAAAQEYAGPIEAVVVDDGSQKVGVPPRRARRSYGTVAWASEALRALAPRLVEVRVVTSQRRLSIGQKRTLAARAARGEVIAHWDDDDMHPPDQLSRLACPILRREAEVTLLPFSLFVALTPSSSDFYRDGRDMAVPFFGSLAYRRSVAVSLGGFADSSLGEDALFAEMAARACHRTLLVRGVPLVYTRHQHGNTWQPEDSCRKLDSCTKLHDAANASDAGASLPPGFRVERSPPPNFAVPALLRAYQRAEAASQAQRSCTAVRRWEPPQLARTYGALTSTTPYMPPWCCSDEFDGGYDSGRWSRAWSPMGCINTRAGPSVSEWQTRGTKAKGLRWQAMLMQGADARRMKRDYGHEGPYARRICTKDAACQSLAVEYGSGAARECAAKGLGALACWRRSRQPAASASGMPPASASGMPTNRFLANSVAGAAAEGENSNAAAETSTLARLARKKSILHGGNDDGAGPSKEGAGRVSRRPSKGQNQRPTRRDIDRDKDGLRTKGPDYHLLWAQGSHFEVEGAQQYLPTASGACECALVYAMPLALCAAEKDDGSRCWLRCCRAALCDQPHIAFAAVKEKVLIFGKGTSHFSKGADTADAAAAATLCEQLRLQDTDARPRAADDAAAFDEPPWRRVEPLPWPLPPPSSSHSSADDDDGDDDGLFCLNGHALPRVFVAGAQLCSPGLLVGRMVEAGFAPASKPAWRDGNFDSATEQHFFNVPSRVAKGLASYASTFPACGGARTFDATPNYMFDAAARDALATLYGPRRLRRTIVVFVLCDPLARAQRAFYAFAKTPAPWAAALVETVERSEAVGRKRTTRTRRRRVKTATTSKKTRRRSSEEEDDGVAQRSWYDESASDYLEDSEGGGGGGGGGIGAAHRRRGRGRGDGRGGRGGRGGRRGRGGRPARKLPPLPDRGRSLREAPPGACDLFAAGVAAEPPAKRTFSHFLETFGVPFVQRVRSGADCARLEDGGDGGGSALRCATEILCGGLYARLLTAWLRLGVRVVAATAAATHDRPEHGREYGRVVVGLKRMLINAPLLGVSDSTAPASADPRTELDESLCGDLPANRAVSRLYAEEVEGVRRIVASHPNVSLLDPSVVDPGAAWLTLARCAEMGS